MILFGMLYTVAVGVPIYLAAVVVSGFLRRHGRAERAAWMVATVLAFTVPAIALGTRASEPETAPLAAPTVETGLIGLPTAVAVVPAEPVTVPVASTTVGLDEILIGFWLLASLLLAARWLVGTVRLDRLTRSCPVDVVDGVRVSLTSELGPAVAGWLRPRILAPAWLMELPPSQRSLVLLHEQEHLRARDPLLIVVSRVTRILMPWNPLLWLLARRLLRAVELDCDRRVLRARPDVEAYGTTLLTVSAKDPGALVGVAAFAETEAPLRSRILAMTTPQSTISVLGLVTALVLGILLLLGAFEVPIPTASPQATTANTIDAGWSGELEETVRALEASLTAQAAALARQEETSERLASLEEEIRRLEASQSEATRTAQAALEQLAMTTPQSTISVLGLVTALVLGILLLLGAFEVPIPTASPQATTANTIDPGWSGELEETVRALEASLTAQAAALARQEETSERLASLEEEIRRLEASQSEATRTAQAALEQLARAREAVPPAPAAASPTDAAPPVAAASTATITGTIEDAVTGEGLENVQVFLRGTGIGALTNRRGRFLLLNVPAGEHEVVAERIGYAERTAAVTLIGGVTVNVNMWLRETALELDALLVTGEPPAVGAAVGAGVGQQGPAPLVFIDGVHVSGPEPANIDELIRREEIDRVEIIKPEAAVPLYGEDARAGVIQIFRKIVVPEEAPPPPGGTPVTPTFTPFTVAPQISNVDEVRAAMREAYPAELRAEGIGGTVEVYFFITDEGIVQDFRINRSSGHDALDDAALAVADVYRFSPALNRDERVAVWVAFPITFVPNG